jgi:Uma2 family endonuclease
MISATQIPVSEYLQTTYRPDREYIDGEVRERNVGKWEHARVQYLMAIWFGQHEKEWGVQGATEWRTQVSNTRVRIPDLVLVKGGPQPDVLATPPVLVIEILSPDDSYADLQDRSHDYQAMGVKTIWIIDPTTRSARMASGNAWTETRYLTVPETEIYANIDELFSSL